MATNIWKITLWSLKIGPSVQSWPKLTTSILISTPTYAIVALTCQYIIKLLPLSHLTDTYKLPVIKLYLTQSGQLLYLCNMYIRWQSSHNNIPVSDEHRYIQNKPVMFIHTILYIVLYWRMKIIFWWYFFGMKDFSQLYSLLFTKTNHWYLPANSNPDHNVGDPSGSQWFNFWMKLWKVNSWIKRNWHIYNAKHNLMYTYFINVCLCSLILSIKFI